MGVLRRLSPLVAAPLVTNKSPGTVCADQVCRLLTKLTMNVAEVTVSEAAAISPEAVLAVRLKSRGRLSLASAASTPIRPRRTSQSPRCKRLTKTGMSARPASVSATQAKSGPTGTLPVGGSHKSSHAVIEKNEPDRYALRRSRLLPTAARGCAPELRASTGLMPAARRVASSAAKTDASTPSTKEMATSCGSTWTSVTACCM